MNFKLKCKVCGEELTEGSNLFLHIQKHPAILYFDTIPEVAWRPATKAKPVEPEVTEDEEGEE